MPVSSIIRKLSLTLNTNAVNRIGLVQPIGAHQSARENAQTRSDVPDRACGLYSRLDNWHVRALFTLGRRS